MFDKLFRTDTSAAQLVIWVALGVVIWPHGAQKVLGWYGGPGLTKTMQIFAGLGFATPATVALLVVEFVGAALLVLGLLTRVWALGIGITISVCMFLNHVQHGFFMNWFGTQSGEGYEYHLLVLGIACALVVRGGGMLSLDRLLCCAQDRRKARIFY
ncbi:MAG TPA: DoxX family protein [Desulfurivibrionaceae bacterium]|nr:DoxX family protein [Desulfurivibrionaceae bacterium]